MQKLFNSAVDASNAEQKLREQFEHLPYTSFYVSTLGGDENASVLFTMSLDAKDEWANRILENSRHAKFHLQANGKLEKISGNRVADFRSVRVNGIQNAITKLWAWLEKSRKEGAAKRFGVYQWRQDGWYNFPVKEYKSEAAAEKFASKMNAANASNNYVVRQVNPVPLAKGTKRKRSDVRIVHNKLLGGWYIVRGAHDTPLSGRFNTKAEAQAELDWRKRHNVSTSRKVNPMKKKPSAAQLRARKAFAAAAKKGQLKKGVKLSRAKFEPTKRGKSISASMKARRANPSTGYGKDEIIHQARLLSKNIGLPLQIERDGSRYQIKFESGSPMSQVLTPKEMRLWMHGALQASMTLSN